MTKPALLLAEDIQRLLGDVTDSTIERIFETGGTRADLEIAYFCLMGDDDRQEGQLGPLDGAAARIFDIIAGDPAIVPPNDR